MKALFVHDHRLKKVKDNYYTTGGLSDTVTRRYTNIFDTLGLVCRASITGDTNGLVKIKNKKLNISPLFYDKLFPSKKVLDHLKMNIEKADIIIVRLPSILGIYAAIISYKLKKKVFVEVVGSAMGSYWHKNAMGKILAIPLEIINKIIIKKANYVLYVSDDYLQRQYPSGGISIGCSDVILKRREKNTLINRLNSIDKLDSKKIVIGTLAQIDQKYKGHKTVFKVIASLKKQGIFLEYRLAGSGNKKYLLSLAKKYKIEENIIFYGQIKHEEVYEWLDSIDIYIQPSLTEGLPRAVIEALYRGCPTIVSNAGGMYELLDDKYIFRKGNSLDLKKIMETLEKEDLKNMAMRNYKFSEKFNYYNLCLKRNNFYKKISEEGKKYEVV